MEVKARMAVVSIGFASAAAEGLRIVPARETGIGVLEEGIVGADLEI